MLAAIQSIKFSFSMSQTRFVTLYVVLYICSVSMFMMAGTSFKVALQAAIISTCLKTVCGFAHCRIFNKIEGLKK